MTRVLYYVHDPMCSWCWAFRPVWELICRELPSGLRTARLLGGLAPDTDQPMPAPMQTDLRAVWQTIQQRVPGTRFNFEFWRRCRPRRSTYPACRAVIAARNQGQEFEEPMVLAIQQAYYLRSLNPSDNDTLVMLAGEIGLQPQVFSQGLQAKATQLRLLQEIKRGRDMGARGFPSLVLEQQGRYRLLDYDYRDPGVVLRQLTAAVV